MLAGVTGTLTSLALIVVFVTIGGFFSGSELAVLTLRESQVERLPGRGGERVRRLRLDASRFLASVQVGVTFAGFFASAYGGATLSEPLGATLEAWGLPASVAGSVAFVSVTAFVSYLSLVLGELVPKRIALQRAEGIALTVSPVLEFVAWIGRPVVWLLSHTTNLIVRLLGFNPHQGAEEVTEEELRDLVSTHRDLDVEERRVLTDVFGAASRQLAGVMVPRTEVEFLDAAWSLTRAVRTVQALPHSRYPVVRGSHDEVVGFVHVRDLFSPTGAARRGAKVGDLSREVLLLPATKRVLPAMSEMRRSGHHLAVVVDEYGGTAGIVTLEDLIEELIGEIRDEYDVVDDETRRLRGGDMEVDGLLNLDDFAESTGHELPDGPYETVAGCLMSTLGRLPRNGDAVEVDSVRLKVTKMDGRRVARVRVTPLDAPEDEDRSS